MNEGIVYPQLVSVPYFTMGHQHHVMYPGDYKVIKLGALGETDFKNNGQNR